MVWSARFYGNRQIFKASFVAPPDVFFGDIMTAREDPISDSRQIDLDVFCPDVDQHDFEAAKSRIDHHSQVIFPSERSLNGEAFSFSQVFVRRRQNLSGATNREGCSRR